MNGMRNALVSIVFRGSGVVAAGLVAGACDVDIPCPGRCFEYTVEYEAPLKCLAGGGGGNFDIPFTGSEPAGYHGRHCFNSSSVTKALDAIDHLRNGGQLSDLAADVQSAYISTVDAVKANVQAECITAAPGQCTNEVQVCTGIAADMYEQLVVHETCVLSPTGTELVTLPPGQACEAVGDDPGTGSGDIGGPCVELTTTNVGVDETASSGGG